MPQDHPTAAPLDADLESLGPYTIIKVLGRGSMGVVYLGRHRVLNIDHALKVLPQTQRDPDRVMRFLREAQQSARLSHPNIIRVVGADVTEDTCYLAMEYVAGSSLDQLARAGTTTLHQAVRYAFQLCLALGYAHNHGMVHRDVKPDNVLIDPIRDQAKLTDFGLVRLQEHHHEPQLTDHGAPMGTPFFMAPEQWYGEGVDHRADLYGLGATLYFLLTGDLPYPGATVGQVLQRLTRGQLVPLRERLPDAPPDLEALIHRAIARDKRARFENAEAFAEALMSWWDRHPCPTSLELVTSSLSLSGAMPIPEGPQHNTQQNFRRFSGAFAAVTPEPTPVAARQTANFPASATLHTSPNVVSASGHAPRQTLPANTGAPVDAILLRASFAQKQRRLSTLCGWLMGIEEHPRGAFLLDINDAHSGQHLGAIAVHDGQVVLGVRVLDQFCTGDEHTDPSHDPLHLTPHHSNGRRDLTHLTARALLALSLLCDQAELRARPYQHPTSPSERVAFTPLKLWLEINSLFDEPTAARQTRALFDALVAQGERCVYAMRFDGEGQTFWPIIATGTPQRSMQDLEALRHLAHHMVTALPDARPPRCVTLSGPDSAWICVRCSRHHVMLLRVAPARLQQTVRRVSQLLLRGHAS